MWIALLVYLVGWLFGWVMIDVIWGTEHRYQSRWWAPLAAVFWPVLAVLGVVACAFFIADGMIVLPIFHKVSNPIRKLIDKIKDI